MVSKGKRSTKRAASSKVEARPSRPNVSTSYGLATCLYCKRTFEKNREWAKYDTKYCRMMHWHTQHRRRTPPGRIVEVDGVQVDKPVIDAKLEDFVQAELARRQEEFDRSKESRK